MYLIYSDESGDSGRSSGGTPFFVISGVIIHERLWNDLFDQILSLRRSLKTQYRIPQRVELHAVDIVNGHGEFHHSRYGLSPTDRFSIYRDSLHFLSQLSDIRVLDVFIKKSPVKSASIDIFEQGWLLFLQRFHNFLDKGGHLQNTSDYGLVFTDHTQDDRLRRILRRMRAYNYIPSQFPGQPPIQILTRKVLDDPIPRSSKHSYFVQIADLIAYSLARRDFPRSKLKRFQFETYFDIIDPILLKDASQSDPQGIVY